MTEPSKTATPDRFSLTVRLSRTHFPPVLMARWPPGTVVVSAEVLNREIPDRDVVVFATKAVEGGYGLPFSIHDGIAYADDRVTTSKLDG